MDESVWISRRAISRRRALSLGGALGLGGLLGACGRGADPSAARSASSTPAAPTTLALLDSARTCAMAREATQGPYWFDVDSIRSDLREGRPGAPLSLALRVQDISECAAGGNALPVASAVVEIWHCDAGGIYSGFESASAGAVNRPGASGGTSNGSYSVGDQEAATEDDGTYLRGAQLTDGNGVAHFTTIYPGWYPGRTVHIHLRVHVDKKTVLTSQLYMDDAVSDSVFAAAPYSSRGGRHALNDDDTLFDARGLLTLVQRGGGYLGVINLGVDV